MRGRREWSWWPLGLLVLAIAGTVSAFGSPAYEAVKSLIVVTLQLVGLTVACRAGLQRGVPARERRPWLLLAGYWALATATSTAFLVAFAGGPGQPPKPGALLAGAILWVSQVAPMLACLLTVAVRPMARGERVRFALDMAAVCGGGFIVLWFLVLAPALSSSLAASKVITIVQPLLHLVIVFAVCAVMMRGGVSTWRHPLSFLLAGNVGLVFTVISVGYVLAHGHLAVNMPITDVVAQTAMVLLITAAVMQRRGGHATMRAGSISRRPTVLPYVALGLGYSVLIAAATTRSPNPWVGLIAGALVMTCAVAGRQFLAARANHHFLIRDTLTGLSSRVAVYDHLDRAVARSRRNGRPAAVLLIDLNGFKPVNDRLGHAAGDELLIAFGDILRGAVRSGDTTGRLGGDEFVVVLPDVTDAATALRIAGSIVAACRAPITVAGVPVVVGASIGVSITEPGRDADGQELLRRADVAMFQVKRRRSDQHVALYDLGMDLDPQNAPAPTSMPGLQPAELARLDLLRRQVAELERKGTGQATTAIGPDHH